MTIQEMRDTAKDYNYGVDWQSGTRDGEIAAAASMICSTLWLVCAEICDRLYDLNNSPERNEP